MRRWPAIVALVLGFGILGGALAVGQNSQETFLPLAASHGQGEPTPTVTITSTPTPTATPSPTPSSTPAPDLEVLSSRTYVDTVGGGQHLVGEVRNNSIGNMGTVRVTVDLRRGNQVVQTITGSAMLSTLLPGETGPFDLGLPDISFDNYAITATGSPTTYDPPDDFAILSSNSYTTTVQTLSVVGELRNDLPDNARFVLVVGTFYNQAGQVWRASQAFTMLEALAPDQRSPFQLGFSDTALDQVESYRLQTRGIAPAAPASATMTVVDSDAVLLEDRLLISGQVRNDGSTQAQRIRVVVTLFDDAGQVSNAGYASLNEMPAGAVRPFELVFSDNLDNYDRYEIQAQGF